MDARDTTVALLIRHAHTDAIGYRLTGRLPGVGLTERGREQAARLPSRLRHYAIGAVYSSPLERALETARPLAAKLGLPLRECDALTEVEFGEWTGLTFDELDSLPAWRRFNEHRSTAPVPGGESALEVQARFVRAIDHLHTAHAGDTIALVTHGDVIRAAVLHAMGAPLDFYHRLEIGPASVTTLRITEAGASLIGVNDEEVPPLLPSSR